MPIHIAQIALDYVTDGSKGTKYSGSLNQTARRVLPLCGANSHFDDSGSSAYPK